ncbi:heterokaryon incompatibility protein-domain-containing protein [Hypoxylon cercidicola]|nr:heterokaryon incompatibility protein-domain-containing protein [Hypoxylon cercidicola]
MLALSSALAEVRRIQGAIRIQREEPLEDPPWTRRNDSGTGDLQNGHQPSRSYWVRLSPSLYRKSPQPTSLPVISQKLHIKYRRLCTEIADGRSEIRLLKLLPGSERDPICCELLYVDLAGHPEYDALSYCWGSPHLTTEVQCDGLPLSITPNLEDALRAFRYEQSSRLLWVDAICINQEDLKEKEHQVPLMGKIFREASNVVVWLGSDTPSPTIATAFNILMTLADLCRRFGWDLDFPWLTRHRMLEQYGLPDITDDSWKYIRDLVERPWFSRTWIIQEITLARQAHLYCGNSTMPWVDFCIGFICLGQSFMLTMRMDILPSVSSFVQTTQLVLSFHQASGLPHHVDLLALLENHRVAKASDARDKIYAFLGLYELGAGRKCSIVPNYHHTATDVFIRAAEEILQHSATLDILGVPRQYPSSCMPGLPSWVPDWSACDFGSALTRRAIDGSYALNFDAAKTTEYSKHVSIQGNILELDGHFFDEVTNVGDVFDPHLRQDSSGHLRLLPMTGTFYSLGHFLSWFNTTGAFSPRLYPTGESIFDATVRTIFLDHFTESNTFETVANNFRRMYIPSHVFRSTQPDGSNFGIQQKLTNLTWSVLARILGPRVFKAIAVVARHWEAHAQMHVLVNLGRSMTSNPSDVFITPGLVGRRMLCTKLGYIGMSSGLTQPDDRIFLIKGSRVPLVFRPRGDEWDLIGDCYIHGIMQGEAFDYNKCQKIKIK